MHVVLICWWVGCLADGAHCSLSEYPSLLGVEIVDVVEFVELMLGVLFCLLADVAVSVESVVGVSVLSGADPVSHTCTVALFGAVVLEVFLDILGCLHMLLPLLDSVRGASCLSALYG